MYMKINKQAGFIPLIIAIIAALSIGGGVWAYKAEKHRKEIKIQEETKLQNESQGLTSNLSEKSGMSSSEDDETYGEDRKDDFGDDGYEDDSYDQDDDDNIGPLPPVPAPIVGGVVKSYTLSEVKLHNTKASCWTAVNGSVYDVTSWISRHPGGAQAITSLCGIDGSSAFNGQHGGQARSASELASFKIGVLK